MQGQTRTYRERVRAAAMPGYRVVVQQTDLQIYTPRPLPELAREAVLAARQQIEAFIVQHPDFLTALVPWPAQEPLPPLVRTMITAGRAAGVGPMAAVAGTVAEAVGQALLAEVPEAIVENGGDVFMRSAAPVTVAVYAGRSPLSMRVGLRVASGDHAVAVCASSGTLGHSLSYGRADAAVVVADDAALADAAATAVGNRVRERNDIGPAVEFGRRIRGVAGVLIVQGSEMGAWGAVELVRLA